MILGWLVYFKIALKTGSLRFEAVARMCSVKKDVLRNFAKFMGKRLCQSLFFNKVAVLRPATLLKSYPFSLRCI